MLTLLILLPLINFALFLTFARYVDRRSLATFVILSMTVALLYLLTLFPAIVSGKVFVTSLGLWMASGLFQVEWNFAVDALTYTMLVVVLTVSTLVHFYSTEYMSEDPHLPRFMSYLSLFTFFMLILISADNFISLFLGWEGVGLCSYLLISFWSTRIQAAKSAAKAMIINRVADVALTIGIIVIYWVFQAVDFATVFAHVSYFRETTISLFWFTVSALSLVTLLLFLGAMGKSAQLGLHTWLPDAMEGPTPVSALIHAATMVTAGVFLIIRTSPLFEATPSVLLFVAFIGAATAFMAATAGLVQNDLKKVIAYSTCSQLGYMVFACGLSSYALSLFHLANHAFFKALLFLSAGAVIHAISNEQDMRRFGGLIQLLPYTHVMFVIGSLALMGFPFLTGFYSKDLILEIAASTLTHAGAFTYWLGLITALFTAFYSLRLLYLAFYGVSRSPRPYLLSAHELTPRMAVSLGVLAIGSIFFGYALREVFVGFGTPFWNGVIHHAPQNVGPQFAGELLPTHIKLLPLMGSILSMVLVFILNEVSAPSVARLHTTAPLVKFYRHLSFKWQFDKVYNTFINIPLIHKTATVLFPLIDRGLLEFLGPTGASRAAWVSGAKLVYAWQTGRIYDYALTIVGGLVVIYLFACCGMISKIKERLKHYLISFTITLLYLSWVLQSASVIATMIALTDRYRLLELNGMMWAIFALILLFMYVAHFEIGAYILGGFPPATLEVPDNPENDRRFFDSLLFLLLLCMFIYPFT